MVVAVRRRVPDNRRPLMGFMLVGRDENRIGVMVRAAAGMGAGGNGKRHTDAQHTER